VDLMEGSGKMQQDGEFTRDFMADRREQHTDGPGRFKSWGPGDGAPGRLPPARCV